MFEISFGFVEALWFDDTYAERNRREARTTGPTGQRHIAGR